LGATCNSGKCCKAEGDECGEAGECCTGVCAYGFDNPKKVCRPSCWAQNCYQESVGCCGGLNCFGVVVGAAPGHCYDMCVPRYGSCFQGSTNCCAGLSCLPGGGTYYCQ